MSVWCYQHDITSWRRKTAHLSLEERGVYRELLDAFYVTEGRLPADIKQLCRIIGAHTRGERRALANIVSQFFTVNGAFLNQKRAASELSRIKEKSEKASRSAQAKHNKNNDMTQANAGETHMRSECERSANKESVINNKKERDPPYPPSDDFTENQNLKLAVEHWNDISVQIGLSKIEKLTDARRARLRARLRDCGGIDGWRNALDKIRESAFLRGDNARGWRADFDFVLQEKSFNKLREGSYSDKDAASAGAAIIEINLDPQLLALLKKHPKFTDAAIKRWLEPCRMEPGRVVAPSAFHADWLEKNFSSALRSVFGNEFKIEAGARA